MVPKSYCEPLRKDSPSLSPWVSSCGIGCSVAICWGLSARLCVPVTPPPQPSPPISNPVFRLSCWPSTCPAPPTPQIDKLLIVWPGCHCVHVPNVSVLGFASEAKWGEWRGFPHSSLVNLTLTHTHCIVLQWLLVHWNGSFCVLRSSKEDYRQLLLICNQMSDKKRKKAKRTRGDKEMTTS